MRDLVFIDSAYPLPRPPLSDGVCFYGGGDTPHVWSPAEVNAQPARYRLPIFVRSNPPGPGAQADVAAMVAFLELVSAPKGTLVAWDSETSADPAYIQAVYYALRAAGWTLIDYGSQSFVFGNQNPDGYYWGADWTSVPHLAPGDAITQFVSFAAYDESLASPALPFWDTRPAPPPPLEDAMFVTTITPTQGHPEGLPIPDGTSRLRFYTEGAVLRVDFFNVKPAEQFGPMIYGQPHSVDLAGAEAVQVYREDAGAGPVTVAGY